MNQFTELSAKQNFTIGYDRKKQSKVIIGELFLVTTPKHANTESAKVMRKKNARLCEGYKLTIDQINELFDIIN